MAESNVMSIFLILAVMVVLGFNIVSAQRKQKARLAQLQQLHEGLQAGDAVLMTCGIHGRVVAVHEAVIELEIAPGVVSVWEKVAVMEVTAPAGGPVGSSDAAEGLEGSAGSEASEDSAEASGRDS